MNEELLTSPPSLGPTMHPKCLGYYNEHTGDSDCEYGTGRKDSEAKCNAIETKRVAG